MVLVELIQILALAIWLAAIGWRATGHGPRRGRFAHQPRRQRLETNSR